ncbi:hypothetical protein QX233_21760 [Chryseobacterium gambrini]|uniref:Uncharacterized protein n=2 Tax=Chryseobacterium TaxID=59732 RepID=A0AAJ1VMP4_9FLAO|nr:MULTISPECIES: hypothetical protein [Chryseobacterium]MCF2218376.1 hypothetical protein [Chryseobacterium sp. PS-8]MDN4015081.1 hypothetical protein [Chryseobacterium gambrini]MDN4028084.1 hypothetical protein [Chryseobacterium gambrini]QWA39799.1 hypothetical protein KKI44_06215 [Chryseobacterium sp. ZHDP1]
MDNNEIDKMISDAKNFQIEKFKVFVEDNNFKEIYKYCFSVFSVNTKKRKFTYTVTVNFDIELNENFYWEETTNGKKLIKVNEKTGAKEIVISYSYKGELIYKSYSDFSKNDCVLSDYEIDTDDLKYILKNKSLVINENWISEFKFKENNI